MALQPLGELWLGTVFLRFRFGSPSLPAFAVLGGTSAKTGLCRQMIEVPMRTLLQPSANAGRSERILSLVMVYEVVRRPRKRH